MSIEKNKIDTNNDIFEDEEKDISSLSKNIHLFDDLYDGENDDEDDDNGENDDEDDDNNDDLDASGLFIYN